MSRSSIGGATALTATLAVLAAPAAGTRQGISVLPGFRVETFARGLSQPTAMAYGPDGQIYLTQTGGTLVAIRRGTRRPVVLVRGLRTPLGFAGAGAAACWSQTWGRGVVYRIQARRS